MPYRPASFGYSDDEWERLLTATDEWLTEKIPTTVRELPHYSDINRAVPGSIGLPPFELGESLGRNGIGYLLAGLNDRLWDEAQCLVSSVVVHKGDLASPIGQGFYSYGRKWGLDPGRSRDEQEDFLFVQQIAAVKFWKERRAAKRRT